ncbi:MAG: hypothetical protein OXB93_02340, partial [Cytophagales bacterium]|nr:hypothetical protein [Cytophagales bacterium]
MSILGGMYKTYMLRVLFPLLGISPLHGQATLSITDFTPKKAPPLSVITVTGTGFNTNPTTYNVIRLGSVSHLTGGSGWVNSEGTEMKFVVPLSWYGASAAPLTVNFDWTDHTATPIATSTASFTPTTSGTTDLSPSDGGTDTSTDLDALDLRYAKKADLKALVDEIAALKRQIGVGGGSRTFGSSVRLEQAISVKPNPASDYLEIQTPEETHVKIIDPTGKVLRAEQIARGVR